MDKIFTTLSSMRLPGTERKTTLVSTIPPSQISTAAGTDVSSFAGCNPQSATVVKRLVSLRERNYLETISATCSAKGKITFSKAGILSTDFARMLELNEDFLDILQTSLALRELSSSSPMRIENPEDLDLIRTNPSKAAAFCLAVFANPRPRGHTSEKPCCKTGHRQLSGPRLAGGHDWRTR